MVSFEGKHTYLFGVNAKHTALVHPYLIGAALLVLNADTLDQIASDGGVQIFEEVLSADLNRVAERVAGSIKIAFIGCWV